MPSYKIIQQDTVLLAQPKMIELFGRSSALFLNQLHYWIHNKQTSGKIQNGIKWVYNNLHEWAHQLKLSERQIQRIICTLREKDVIHVERLSGNKSNRTNYYTINYQKLEKLTGPDHLIDETPVLKATSNHDILSSSSRQNVVMVIQNSPHKEFNKSDEIILNEKTKKNEPFLKQVLQDQNNFFKENMSSPKNTTSQDMLKLWNLYLSKAQTAMRKDLAPLLVAAFKHKFDENLEQWEHYCKTLATSSYLMSNAFDLNLKWALKYATIERVRAGGFGVKDVQIQPDIQEAQRQALQHITQCNEDIRCKEIRQKILQAFGAIKYNTWLTRVCFEKNRTGEGVILKPNSAFVAHYIEREFGDILKNL